MASQESSASESSNNQPVKTTPKDALVMASILKEMGVTEYEPRIINQMVEFAYRMCFISFILTKILFSLLHWNFMEPFYKAFGFDHKYYNLS